MTFYPSQVHTLSLTTFECRSSHARQQDRSPILSHSLSQSQHLHAPFHRLSPACPSLSLAPRRLFVARTIRETGAPFISVTRSLYLSTWPTHRNKFHPPTLPFTHFSPADHPLRIGKQAIRLSRRPIFRRPTDRPVEKMRQRSIFSFAAANRVYTTAAIFNSNYARVYSQIIHPERAIRHTFQTRSRSF